MNFPTSYTEILGLLDAIDPIKYGKNRNFIDGNVSRLSPYVSRGVISTKQIAHYLIEKGYQPHKIETFIRELAWRDYFQMVWNYQIHHINTHIKQPQLNVGNYLISKSIVSHQTGIYALDQGIETLYATGYMHNHLRMYIAALSTNVARSHWLLPAKWMYYHLLDADWGSNALSWQWVSASFSSKKYYANQENINRYCYTSQKNTFLDVSYEAIAEMPVPDVLADYQNWDVTTILPKKKELILKPDLPICIYNFYNLDPNWLQDRAANRILLLEPDFFQQYPVSDRVFEFFIKLSSNIFGLQVFVGNFDELHLLSANATIFYKEHPTTAHYKGIKTPRDWLFEGIDAYFPSFFSFWKKAEKNLKHL